MSTDRPDEPSSHEPDWIDVADGSDPGQLTHLTLHSKSPPPTAAKGAPVTRGDRTAAGSSRPGRPVGASRRASFEPQPFAQRYQHRRLLGRGGMGEVRLYRDRAIGREVAIKAIREDHELDARDAEARFVREVRVQGQLEHPAIVPVYDAGRDSGGALYLSMKRVRGIVLGDVLRALQRGDAAMSQRYSRRRLLTVFSNVCMAVHYAHRKGVVHRDLKPANIMLGDFGEVYLLDWGIAALRGEMSNAEPVEEVSTGDALATHRLGTPGYMAPEQATRPSEVDQRADVYALGAILFELLTLQKLHPDQSAELAVESTLRTEFGSPLERVPEADIPPELDALCRAATRRDPRERLDSAEALSSALEAFLDGDRDLALRRALAQEHYQHAQAALARADSVAAEELSARARAMREVGATLGLDPKHEGALRTLIELLTKPPKHVPPNVRSLIGLRRESAHAFAVRASIAFYASTLLYLPLLLWMGVRSWPLFLTGYGAVLICAAIAVHSLSRSRRGALPWGHLLVSTLTVMLASTLFGPFVFVPTIAMGQSISYVSSVGSGRGWVAVLSAMAVVVPWTLEVTGVLPNPYLFEDGVWTILPGVVGLPALPTQLFLLATSLGTILPASYLVERLRAAYDEADRTLQLQAWQLRQMVSLR